MTHAEWRSNIPRATAAVQHANAEAVQDVTEDLMALSQAAAPVDMGDLVRSAKASTDGGGDVVHGAVSYDQPPYDEIQHRRTDFKHDTGGPHYLDGPLNVNRPRYHEMIAARIREALG